MCVSFFNRLGIVLGLSALSVLTPYSQASASGCCEVTSNSPEKVMLVCKSNNVEAQVRAAGDKSAALLRVHPGLGSEPIDIGTYMAAGQVAVVRGILNGHNKEPGVVLNAFVDGLDRLNYVISYRAQNGQVFVTSDIAGSGPVCETSHTLVEFSEKDLPLGTTLVATEGSASTANAVYSKLFGG